MMNQTSTVVDIFAARDLMPSLQAAICAKAKVYDMPLLLQPKQLANHRKESVSWFVIACS